MKLNIKKFNQYYNYKYINDELYIISKTTNKEKPVFLNQKIYLSYGIDVPNTKEEADEFVRNIEELEKKELAQKIIVNDLYKDLLGFTDDELFLMINNYSKKSGDYIDKLLKEINFVDCKTSDESIQDKYYIKELDTLHFSNMYNLSRKLGLYKISEELYATQYLITSIDDYDYIQHFYSKEPKIDTFDRTELIFKIDSLLRDYSHIENFEFVNINDDGKLTHWTDTKGNLNFKIKKLRENIRYGTSEDY